MALAACSGLSTNSMLNAVRPRVAQAMRDSTLHLAPEIAVKVVTDFPRLFDWRTGLDTKPPSMTAYPPVEAGRRGEAHPLARSGQARMRLLGHRGTGAGPGVGPPGKNPGHELSQGSSAGYVNFVSKKGRKQKDSSPASRLRNDGRRRNSPIVMPIKR